MLSSTSSESGIKWSCVGLCRLGALAAETVVAVVHHDALQCLLTTTTVSLGARAVFESEHEVIGS